MIPPLVPKILILESQMMIAADVSLQFLKLGYDVIGINTCSEDAFKTIEDQHPDIVLTSIQLRGSVNGLQTARTILKRFQIPVVFLSANTDVDVFKSIIEMQAYAFISKPFEEKDLQKGIETALNRMISEGKWPKHALKGQHKIPPGFSDKPFGT